MMSYKSRPRAVTSRCRFLLVSELRGPASVAQTVYRESERSREMRLKAAQERKAMMSFTPAPEGRPSKRDRHKIIQFRHRG
jgi:ribosome-associated heat shock protein Hsp15